MCGCSALYNVTSAYPERRSAEVVVVVPTSSANSVREFLATQHTYAAVSSFWAQLPPFTRRACRDRLVIDVVPVEDDMVRDNDGSCDPTALTLCSTGVCRRFARHQ